ncbi:hypothetical protein BKP45_01710 [Anaerobacillus alkalidiazotrophicus]|uniref:Uncharacterized protein n=1 Tax=Anaerobacillus alkalidiazotrophicus TaxID=472963 RepID=A0A1S2MAA6_9BACI|nr:hypothetical protein [Anaerobacillus alkalidiazotrophicus]OIJ21510.1 hypothetical protein BKP45_01710 [Anaerobacillus alkalidiazotrophicus]
MTKKGNDSFSKGEKENFKKLIDSYKLSPQQIAVVAAVLFNALYVQSVLVDRNQTVVIILEGSLRKNNNPGMEKLLNEVKGLSIGELMELLQSKS